MSFSFRPGDPNVEKGVWKGWRHGLSNKVHILLSCPTCGFLGSLDDHEIAADGLITPSVDCPNESCAFHESGCRLEGWKHPA